MNLYKIEKLPLRPLIYGVLLLYIFLDYFLHGPAYRRLTRGVAGSEAAATIAREEGWVATVNTQPITGAQLDAAVDLHLARRGRVRSDHNDQNLLIIQLSVLNDLVNDELVRQWSRAQPVEVPEEWVQQRIEDYEKSFLPEALNTTSAAHELTPERRRSILASHARQQYWIESKIGKALEVTEDEIREFYDTWREHLHSPQMTRSRHIFFSTVEDDSPAREEQIRDLYRQLQDGADFEELALRFSEDSRTKTLGGDLGWFSDARMPEAFMTAISDLGEGEVSAPFRTPLGWHIAEVIDRRESRELTLEEAGPEIRQYLENTQRAKGVDAFVNQLRRPRWANVQFFEAARELRRE